MLIMSLSEQKRKLSKQVILLLFTPLRIPAVEKAFSNYIDASVIDIREL